jgi:hypothetical protein
MQTELTIATAASKRLKMDGRSLLSLMSMVGNALNNLARQTANDSLKRMYLMTNPASVTKAITNSTFNYYADLTTLIASPQIMLDNLQYGTVFYIYPTGTCASDDGGGVVAQIAQTYPTGLAVRITNTTGNFVGLSENTTYYLIYISTETYKFATTLANALAGTAITTSTGTPGTVTVTPYERTIAQWLQSPNQASFTQAIPFSYTYIWLENNLLYTNQTAGSFAFNVPFIPSLVTLPEILESDLIDNIVTLATAQGFEPITPAIV